MSKYDPLNQENKNFNLFFESYFAKGMPCIFSNGGLNDPAPVTKLNSHTIILGRNKSFGLLWLWLLVDHRLLSFPLYLASKSYYCKSLTLFTLPI